MTGERAVVLVGHGSHLNARSATPVFDHADAIRERDGFAEVREAFWKEEPSLRNALRTVESDEVFVVPVFTSEGYFTEQVLPRELRLTAEYGLDVDKTVYYTPPVGTHESMTDVVARRAETVTGDPDVGPGFGVAVVGHGTERNEGSDRSTRSHVERLRRRDRFDEVRPLFLDEDPRVETLTDRFESDDVVVVPLFVADGYHTTTDIPEEIGIAASPDGGFDAPQTVDGVRVWYAGAVGTEPLVADVALERIAEASADPEAHAVTASPHPDGRGVGPDLGDAREAFAEWVDAGRGADDALREWGELAVLRDGDGDGGDGSGGYELRHRDDRTAASADLQALGGVADARDVARHDDYGRYRPLKGAPSLRTGWRLPGLDAAELVDAVGYVYPASVINWHRERTGALDVSHYRPTAERQTGIYAEVSDLDSDEVERLASALCAGCTKRREWDEREGEPLDAPRGDGEIPCREPCSFLVAAAREFHREDWDATETEAGADAEAPAADGRSLRALIRAAGELDRTVGEGDFGDPANPYRVRYRRARANEDDTRTDEHIQERA